MSPRAGETLAELTPAIRHGMRASAVAGITHAYPTFADAAWNATVAKVRARLASHVDHLSHGQGPADLARPAPSPVSASKDPQLTAATGSRPPFADPR